MDRFELLRTELNPTLSRAGACGKRSPMARHTSFHIGGPAD